MRLTAVASTLMSVGAANTHVMEKALQEVGGSRPGLHPALVWLRCVVSTLAGKAVVVVQRAV